MRVIGEVPHPQCKITLFSWNNRYLIKFENGLLEQTFKINEYDVTNEAELLQLVDETFIQETLSRFDDMRNSLYNALQRI